ncbi:MAG: AAA family ATPase [Chloroflexi bacterium]|nr:AAA family ATPase [Chloroflexota bacterium]
MTIQTEVDLERSVNGTCPTYHSPIDKQNYSIINAAYALQPRPPIPWIVDNLLQPQSLAMLVGQYGIGKTFATVDLGVCVAMGIPWLDRATRQCPVLLVDEESGNRRLADRLGMSLRGHGAGEDVPIHGISFAGVDLGKPERIDFLERLITDFQAGLVIMDAFIDLIPGADENSAQEMTPALRALRAVAEHTTSCVLPLHHTNKKDQYRGSTSIPGVVDLMLTMKRAEDSDMIRFEYTKARDVKRDKLAAQMHFEDGKVWLSSQNAAAVAEKRLTPTEQYAVNYVLEFLRRHPDSPMDTIAGSAAGCSPYEIRQAVYYLARLEQVRRTDGGTGTTKATYGLAQT